MYGTSPEMLRRMYVKGSLQNRDDGFVFQVKNQIDSGSLSGIAKVAVDGEERELAGATLELNGKTRQLSEISWRVACVRWLWVYADHLCAGRAGGGRAHGECAV